MVTKGMFLDQFSVSVVFICLFFSSVSPQSKERQIGEMMKNSGGSSQQLSMLNEQLSQKNRLVNASYTGRYILLGILITVWVSDQSDTNWPLQSQNKGRSLTFRI